MSEKKNPVLDKAFADLLAEDDAKALEALALIHQQGNASSILPLLHALVETDEPQRRRRIVSLLFEVKVKDAATELGKALDLPGLATVRATIISAFWNAGLDAAPYLERLAQIAVEGSPEETFEVLTVVENQELLPEKAARKALARVKKAIGVEEDPYKKTLLGELEGHLKDRLGAHD